MIISARRAIIHKHLWRGWKSRGLATQAFITQFVKQGGLLHCDTSNLEKCIINITSKWQDHCEISYDDQCMVNLEITEHDEENEVTIRTNSSQPHGVFKIDITIPEYLDVVVEGNELALTLASKVIGRNLLTTFSLTPGTV